jgi:DNA polymerase
MGANQKPSEESGASSWVPDGATLPRLAAAAQKCQGCELYKHATQAVLGDGPATSRVVMVGEQPGDREDIEGKPFVGPAGGLLERALGDAGLSRGEVYITNAVKHFKFEERGKRRIHKKPSSQEIAACHPWLEAELAIVRPEIVVCLGSTAARAVFGRPQELLKNRGKVYEVPNVGAVTMTVHPSSVLRSPDPTRRNEDYQAFVRDLRAVRTWLVRRRTHTA